MLNSHQNGKNSHNTSKRIRFDALTRMQKVSTFAYSF